jgi:hypothetical protein
VIVVVCTKNIIEAVELAAKKGRVNDEKQQSNWIKGVKMMLN